MLWIKSLQAHRVNTYLFNVDSSRWMGLKYPTLLKYVAQDPLHVDWDTNALPKQPRASPFLEELKRTDRVMPNDLTIFDVRILV